MQLRTVTLVVARVVDTRGVVAHSLRFSGGRIVGVDVRPRRGDVVLDLDGAFVFPGLINGHDHLALNHLGRVRPRSRYDNASAWARDVEATRRPSRLRLRQRMAFGARKNLLAGTTTVCHHDPAPRFQDLGLTRIRCGWAHSLYLDDVGASWRASARHRPWVVHLAEGTDDAARQELDQLEAAGALHANTVVVHGVGLDAEQRRRLALRGRGLVWCPSSNHFLLGTTADRDGLEGRVALGTDSRLTGARDLLDELGQADAPPDALFRMVSTDAARMFGRDDIGTLRVGARADLIVLPSRRRDPFDALVGATRSDLSWVIRGGVPVVGVRRRLFRAQGRRVAAARLDGHKRWVRPWLLRLSPPEPGLQ